MPAATTARTRAIPGRPGARLAGVVLCLRRGEGPYRVAPVRDGHHVEPLPSTLVRHLPAQTTTLVGRPREIGLLVQLLREPEVRLVTLTGPGGVGKTRLALAVAVELSDAFPDGICFVDLSALVEPSLVPSTIARALGVRGAVGREPLDHLTEYLVGKSLLLVLDNFEQLLAAAPVVAQLLAASLLLRVLVTSRAVLHLSGEHEFPVPPLTIPDPQHAIPQTLLEYEAASLFVQRARASRPDFQITAANAPAVAEICARLDGLPLALELAAARSRVLPAQTMLARLTSRLGLLTGGPRDLPARQQTLRKTIDWSYGLLELAEQRLFGRLAVFGGGCSLDAAEVVCRPSELGLDTLEGLASLVDKSLLRQWETPDAQPRFGMLETIREYALERLEESGDGPQTRERHTQYCLELAERAEPELTGPNQIAWLDRLELEHDNLRATLHRALDTGDGETALRLAGALMWLWLVHGHLTEGRRWLEQALSAAPNDAPPLVRAKALHGAGVLAWNQIDLAAAESLLTAALDLRRRQGDRRGSARSLGNLATLKVMQQDFAAAQALYEESLALARAEGDGHNVGTILNNLGLLARDQGDYARARTLLEESLATRRQVGDQQGAARAVINLGMVARRQREYARAQTRFEEGLRLADEVSAKDLIAYALEGLAEVARAGGWLRRAARLLGAAAALREAGAAAIHSPEDVADHQRLVASIRERLGEEAFVDASSTGRDRPLIETIREALTPPAPATKSSKARPSDPLTPREMEIAVLVARGYTNRQIADELVITEGTAELHVVHILNKLGFHSRSQIAAWIGERGIAATTVTARDAASPPGCAPRRPAARNRPSSTTR